MSKKLKHQEPNPGAPTATSPTAAATHCTADGCKKKAEKMSFCSEHYDWFKFGLITREGHKPIDFQKKWESYQRLKSKAA